MIILQQETATLDNIASHKQRKSRAVDSYRQTEPLALVIFFFDFVVNSHQKHTKYLGIEF